MSFKKSQKGLISSFMITFQKMYLVTYIRLVWKYWKKIIHLSKFWSIGWVHLIKGLEKKSFNWWSVFLLMICMKQKLWEQFTVFYCVEKAEFWIKHDLFWPQSYHDHSVNQNDHNQSWEGFTDIFLIRKTWEIWISTYTLQINTPLLKMIHYNPLTLPLHNTDTTKEF